MKIRSILRSALNHPFIVSTIFCVLIIYRHLPTLFNILIASFPVIFFTAIFLGIILIYGKPNLQPTNPRKPINTTRAILTKPESYKLDDSDSYSYSDSTSESEINPTLDEINPLLSDSESESDKGTEKKEETEKEERKMVAWTADDTKTLQQIGTLELERNTHLENLIAKRKAVRKIIERDLIDLEGFDSTQFQIQPVIAPKRNPFDLPYEEEIPGSAPSVLLPITRNPFDFPFDQPEESEYESHVPTFDANGGNSDVVNSGVMSSNDNDFRRNEKLFRRHESFTIGAPVQYRFKPFFVPEKMDLEEDSEVEREISEKSSSLERETPSNRDDVSSESDESSSEGGGRKKVGEMTDDESNDVENNENYSSSSQDDNNEDLEGKIVKTMEDNEDLEGKNGKTMVLGSHHEDSDEDEEQDDDDDDTDSNVEQLHKEEEPIVECHVADPVYDSSPTAHEKPSLLVEALFNDANTEAESDSREIEMPSPPKEKQTSNEEAAWVAPSLASVDEIESRSRELSEIREHDIIGAQLSEIHDDLSCPITPMVRDLDR